MEKIYVYHDGKFTSCTCITDRDNTTTYVVCRTDDGEMFIASRAKGGSWERVPLSLVVNLLNELTHLESCLP